MGQCSKAIKSFFHQQPKNYLDKNNRHILIAQSDNCLYLSYLLFLPEVMRRIKETFPRTGPTLGGFDPVAFFFAVHDLKAALLDELLRHFNMYSEAP